MTKTEQVYAELDAASRAHEFLAAVNSFSLDTAEKRLQWDIAYRRAGERLNAAMQARDALVREEAEKAK